MRESNALLYGAVCTFYFPETPDFKRIFDLLMVLDKKLLEDPKYFLL